MLTRNVLVIYLFFSAGVGRSGTYVGLDYLYDQAVSTGSVKVFDCVLSMRKHRINMVQTKVMLLLLLISGFLDFPYFMSQRNPLLLTAR